MLRQFKGVYNNIADGSYLRNSIKNMCYKIGFMEKEIDEINLCLTEILTNVDKYGGKIAELTAEIVMNGNLPVGIEIKVIDYGPGIENIELALMDKYSTKIGSLGLGLGAIKRLSDKFIIDSKPSSKFGRESGTTVIFTKMKKNRLIDRNTILRESVNLPYDSISQKSNTEKTKQIPQSDAYWIKEKQANRSLDYYRDYYRKKNESSSGDINKDKSLNREKMEYFSRHQINDWNTLGRVIPKKGQRVSGDAIFSLDTEQNMIFCCADGLGHGYSAKIAADYAIDIIRDNPNKDLIELMELIHETIKGTVGVQILIGRINKVKNELQYVGVGNIRGFIVQSKSIKFLYSINGTIGKTVPSTMKVTTMDISEKSVIVIHSDGLSRSWVTKIKSMKNYMNMSIASLQRIILTYNKIEDDSSLLLIKN